MAVSVDLSDVPIRLAISEMLPGAEFHFAGRGDYGNQYDAIGEWYSKSIPKPTAQQIRAFWDNRVSPAPKTTVDGDLSQIKAILATIETRLQALEGGR